MTPTQPNPGRDPASTLFDEGSLRTDLASLHAALQRCQVTAAIALDHKNSERVRLGALLQVAEDAVQAASAAQRLGLDSRYLAGFLHGAGVHLNP